MQRHVHAGPDRRADVVGDIVGDISGETIGDGGGGVGGGGAVSAFLSCKDIEPACQRKILRDNASAFYGVAVPAKATAA